MMVGKRRISADTAFRLGHWLRNSREFWLNLQASYDLRVAKQTVGKDMEAYAGLAGHGDDAAV